MKIDGYGKLTSQEKEILHALLERDGIKVKPTDIVDAPADTLGIDWCKILCAVKGAVAIAACGGNPVCIAGAIAASAACVKGCK
jgi:hypothetical protein